MVLYNAVIVCLVAVASPYFLYQAVRHRKYVANLRQRLGDLPASLGEAAGESIWIQAVSVGEVLAARALIPGLRERYPHLRVVVSTTTITGQQVARTQLEGVEEVFYFPIDLSFVVARTLDRVRPRLFIMMETEIWPNLLRLCHLRGVKTVLVNGRISPKSYRRYRLVRPMFRRILAGVDRFCAQSEESARRLVDLGADPRAVTMTGSLKFDSVDIRSTPLGDVQRYFRVSPQRQVIIAASTRRGEETAVLRAFGRVRATAEQALLILAPRHPERFAEVEQIATRAGYRVRRRSELRIDAEPRADVVLLDTIGELARLYPVATAVFVGGSLVPAGGHNVLEPAVFGKPIVFGPHMENFAEIAEAFVSNEAAWQVRSGQELEEALATLLSDPVRQARLGAAARALVEANRGAREKTLALISALMPSADAAAPRKNVIRPFRAAQ